MAFVKGEGGPHGLVPAWLVEKQLEQFLKDYVKPEDLANEAKRARSGIGGKMAAVSYESTCTLYPPRADRFKRVAPLEGSLFFKTTECRKEQ